MTETRCVSSALTSRSKYSCIHWLLVPHTVYQAFAKGFVPRERIAALHKDTQPLYPEFLQICKAVAIGFAVMGFIGYFVKLIHIPMCVSLFPNGTGPYADELSSTSNNILVYVFFLRPLCIRLRTLSSHTPSSRRGGA